MAKTTRDHGGGLDAAVARFGGTRADWVDLSTGINPEPYPLPAISANAWAALPDNGAEARLVAAARRFWNIPDGAGILPAPGASALIAALPRVLGHGTVRIDTPTYNEHAAAFSAAGWGGAGDAPDVHVVVHPNNPTGAFWDGLQAAPLTIVDESFCDPTPGASLVPRASAPGTLVLKSFGKFWGLAGLRLGFLIGDPKLLADLQEAIGPWAVSGPALITGAAALEDRAWANATRDRLARDAPRLDALVMGAGAKLVGGTTLFRLYQVNDAQAWQTRLATKHIWSRIFPYSGSWLRLGLPPAHGWDRLEAAL